jgi:hypothetical protein
MVEELSTNGETNISDASIEEKDSYDTVGSSESEDSSSGEKDYFQEKFLKLVDRDEKSIYERHYSSWNLMIDLGKISNVYRYPNNKVGDFYPCPPYLSIRKMIRKFKGESYEIVLARCWQINPICIEKGDIKYIKMNATKTKRAFLALVMLALYTLRFNIRSDTYHSVFKLLPLLKTKAQKRLLVIISSNYSKHNGDDGHVQKHRKKLIELLKRVPFDEASIQVAIALNYELGDYRINGLLEKDMKFYIVGVLDYYQKFKSEEVTNLLSKWIAFFMNHPGKDPRINDKFPKSLKDAIRKDLELQKKFLQLLICEPKYFHEWKEILNFDIFDDYCTKLYYIFYKNIEKVENPTSEDLIILNYQELETIHDPKIDNNNTFDFEYELIYKGDKRVLNLPLLTSYGSLIETITNGKNAMTPFYVESYGTAYASESIIGDSHWKLEIKEGYPPENKFLLFPVSPELGQNLKEHGNSGIVKRLDYGRHEQLLDFPATFNKNYQKGYGSSWAKKNEQIIGKWNHVMMSYSGIFSLKTRLLWFKSLLGPERYSGKELVRKQYKVQRETLFEQGLKILRRNIASYWVRLRFRFEGEDSDVRVISAKEFYSEYSRELIKRLLNESSDECEWKDLGYLIARCILDGHFIDLHSILYIFNETLDDSALEGKEKEEFIEETKSKMNLIEEGIKDFFRSNPFSIFRRDEIPMLLGNNLGKPVIWVPSGGYHDFSTQFLWLIKVFNEFDSEMQSSFFQFVSGNRVLGPNTRITVVPLKGDDNFLPMAKVCSNFMKLPRYTSEEVLAKKLIYALTEGLTGFNYYFPRRKY